MLHCPLIHASLSLDLEQNKSIYALVLACVGLALPYLQYLQSWLCLGLGLIPSILVVFAFGLATSILAMVKTVLTMSQFSSSFPCCRFMTSLIIGVEVVKSG